MSQMKLFSEGTSVPTLAIPPLKTQLLKWVGNKQRSAHEIASHFPADYVTYYEPFLGSGAVLGTFAPRKAVGSDALRPLIEIWELLSTDPDSLLHSYREWWEQYQKGRDVAYEEVKARFNQTPNGRDLLFLSRSCYGGVVRFRKDGYMSTPIGAHNPVPPDSMARRIALWRRRTAGTRFACCDFEEAMESAGPQDVVYCDPPYSHTQAILYGSQEFTLARLFSAIGRAKNRGAFVALSIDGSKKSGNTVCDIRLPDGLFERVAFINCGRSMLRRFQMRGETLESEVVADRLALTW